MKYFKVFPHMQTEELLGVLHSQKEIRAFKDWQIIYSVAVNVSKTAADLSILLGVIPTRYQIAVLIQLKSVIDFRVSLSSLLITSTSLLSTSPRL
ncbi:hypothetical protein EZS27_026873 [termite gut metagenome]|uniref:Uncharacterized protein n=3 Tax=termite gut metagenome TaxID=433724 RepID=A0A5J4QR10_9ZZZZ